MKYVGAAEFKANCLRLMAEMQANGEPITVTKRGKPLATVSPPPSARSDPESLFGCMRGTVVIHGDLDEPIAPDWEAEWEAKWDGRGLPVLRNVK